MNRRAVDSDGRPGVDEKFSSRRGPTLLMRGVLAAVAAVLVVVTVAAPSTPVSATEAPRAIATTDDPPPAEPSTPTSEPLVTRPPISANDFLPEDRDLTSCIGVLERPGCGSESRGGWHQRYVLIALLIGMVVVFGNVVRGVRKRGASQTAPAADDT